MYHIVLAQVERNEFLDEIALYLAIAFGGFIVCLYLFRSIFNIPSFLRYQKAQIRLLEEIAKAQGVDNTKVQSIVTESIGWTPVPQNQPKTKES